MKALYRFCVPAFTLLVWLATVGDGRCLAQATPGLSFQTVDSSNLRISWPDSGGSFRLETAAALGASAVWTTAGQVPGRFDGGFSVTVTVTEAHQFFRLRPIPLTFVQATSPLDQEQNVSVTRETIVRFSAPLGTNSVIKPDTFYAGFGGRRILSRTQLSSDRRTATLFYLEPLPGSARVTVVFDGTGLVDEAGAPLDADGDGVAGGSTVFTFDTFGLTPLPGTAIVGTIYASELIPGSDTGTNAVNRPLEGVTITVDGMEESLRTRTDAMGKFKLEPVPSGKFFVHLDGRTARSSAWPAGDFYPTVGKQWEAKPGRIDNLAGGTGLIFLPQIKAGTLQPVSATQDTLITFLPEVVRQNPALAGVSITVPANALYGDNGTRGGKVGIAPVPPDRLPGPLPPGLEMPIVITVQTDGALNFDRPAPICFPNLPDPVLKTPLPAGSKQALISFNHDKGIWEAVGSMTVSADGKLICTDPGSGILQPGWHGVGPTPVGPPPPNLCPLENPEISTASARRNLRTQSTKNDCSPPKCQPNQQAVKDCEKHALGLFNGWIWRNGQRHFRGILQCQHDYKDRDDLVRRCYALNDKVINLRYLKYRDAYFELLKECELCGDQSASARQAGLSASPADSLEAQGIIIEQFAAILQQITILAAAVPPARDWASQNEALLRQAAALLGGDPIEYLNQVIADAEERSAAYASQIGVEAEDLEPFSQPPYSILYAATIERPGGIFVLRGETGALGQYSLFVPRDGELLEVSFYDPRTGTFGFITPNRSSKARYPLPRFFLSPIPAGAADSDGDGAVDVVEEVYGTDPDNKDSDGDGILDGAEISQGNNPLDGRPVRTGIVGTAKTPGAALDVAATDHLAVAEGPSGVSLFNIVDGLNPRLVAHISGLGDAQRVAMAGAFIAVASRDIGVQIIDANTSPTPAVVRSLRRAGAQAIAADNGIAYAGFASGAIVALDLSSGRVVQELSVTNAVWDLALHRDHLYALTDNRLFVISLASDGFTIATSIGVPSDTTPNRRLFVGGGIAYTVHGRGYNSIDVADPTLPMLLTTGRSAQFGWRHLAANGSGTAVAAVGINSISAADVFLYDFSDPRKNDQFLTQYLTPGTASAVAIHNGFAYVADGTEGLQVVNYLSFDTQSVPPTITLATSAIRGVAESSQPLRVTANAVDDVQVRHVEFYLDGQRVFNDGSFPFEFRFNLPALTSTKTNVLLRARAIDTGGNATWSDELKIQLGPDVTPPRVVGTAPLGGAKAITQVFAFFNEPMNPTTLNPGTFRLSEAGTDGLFDTLDDRPVGDGAVGYRAETSTASLSFAAPLPLGLYRAVVTAEVADVTGNRLTTDHRWDFRVADAVFWISDASGSWNDGANWSAGMVPGPNDDVILENLPATVTVSHIAGTTLVRNLKAGLPLQISGGSTFQAGGKIDLQAPLTLDNGTLKGSQVVQNGGARLRFAPNAANILDGMRITGDLVLTNTSARAVVRNGLDLSGTVLLDNAGALVFAGNQTFNTGSIRFAGGVAALNLEPGTTLTLGPEMVVHGKFGVIQANAFGAVKLINQGRIAADVPGGVINVALGQFENQGRLVAGDGTSFTVGDRDSLNTGTIEVQPGGTFTWNGAWTNQGTLQLNQGTLNLGGSFTLARLGNVARTAGTLNLNGTLELGGETLALNASTGSWRLDRGTLRNGTVTQSADARLQFAPNAANTLDGMRVTGDLVLTNTSARAVVRNGLDLSGTVLLDNAGALVFAGNQTFNTGSILFAGGALNLEPGTTLTLGPEMVVHGKFGVIQASAFGAVKLINQGRIAADVPGGVINVALGQFENQGRLVAGDGTSFTVGDRDSLNTGTIEVQPGGTFTWNGAWANQGTLQLNQGTLNLGGSFTLARLGNVARTAGTLNLNGTLELGGETLALNASTGSWRLDRGTLRNGTVTQTAEARLHFAPNAANTLDALKVTGDLMLTNTSARAVVRNGLELTGTVLLDNAGTITFAGNQTFNTGSIRFAGGALNLEPGTTLTLGPDMVVHGKFGSIQANAFGTVKLINQGRIAADVPGGVLNVALGQFENQGQIIAGDGASVTILEKDSINTGTIEVRPSATFTWNGSWTNQGTLRLNAGTLNLGGSFTLARLGNVVRTAGTLNLNGTLELGGETLALNPSTGSWRLDRGTLRNGTVTQTAEARLHFAPNAANTLDGMRVNGDLMLTNTSARAVVRNGLDLAGTVVLENAGTLVFAGNQTFNTGSILFAGGALNLEPGTTLTLGPDMIVHGKFGSIQANAFGTVKLINQGLITVDVPGGTLNINLTQFENAGTLRADGAGTTMRIVATPFVNTGTIQEVNGGTVVHP